SFFVQAEDGIRAFHVTGVPTCALPIWSISPAATASDDDLSWSDVQHQSPVQVQVPDGVVRRLARVVCCFLPSLDTAGEQPARGQIGRASCRERGEWSMTTARREPGSTE